MTIGSLLVLVGTLLCVVAIFIDRTGRASIGASPILAVGATLIGIGVLVGDTKLVH